MGQCFDGTEAIAGEAARAAGDDAASAPSGEGDASATTGDSGTQPGAVAGGSSRPRRSSSRRIRSPSIGPSVYSGIGLSQTDDPSDTASAPAQKYSRQSSKSAIPPLAMIGSRNPASRSSATTRS